MPAEVPSPKIAQSILQGQTKLVIWGNTRSLTFHEWQRQIPAEFVADTQWGWWNDKFVHGLEVCSPSTIADYSTTKTIISNNYYYSPVTSKIEDYLQRIGGYRTIKPTTLYDMARLAGHDKHFDKHSGKGVVKNINNVLADMLTMPADLEKRKKLPSPHELIKFFNSYEATAYLQENLPQLREDNAASYRARKGHVCLLIGALHAGGAERQICNLAVGLKRAGWTPTVLVYNAGHVETAHYRQFLIDNGVNYHIICPPEGDDYVADALAALDGLSTHTLLALWHIRAEILLHTLHTYKILRQLRPELLISYLDWQNVYSGLGATLAGTPRLLMSGRNAAPTNFPHFYGAMTDSFKDIYKLVLRQSGMVLSNNSDWGGASYAEWLDLPPKKIPTVLNGITEEFRQPIKASLVKIKRRELGLRDGQPLILGVFRLAPEKHPLDFIRVIAVLHKKHPHMRAIICGAGSLEDEVLTLIHKLKLDDVVSLHGVVDDIPLMMKAATILLHTSEAEGSPNVILEAQAIGLPVVCTDSGGIRPCLARHWLSFMEKLGDIKGLAAGCDKLLGNAKLRKKLAVESRREVLRRFSVATLTHNTLTAAGTTSKQKTTLGIRKS